MIGQLVLDQAYKKVKQRNFEHFQQKATDYGIRSIWGNKLAHIIIEQNKNKHKSVSMKMINLKSKFISSCEFVNFVLLSKTDL